MSKAKEFIKAMESILEASERPSGGKLSKERLDGVIAKLGLTGHPVAREALKAYGDLHDLPTRDLSYFASKPVKGPELIKLMSAIVSGYNDFDGNTHPKQLVDSFGEHAEYFIAREGSVCIYVNPKVNVWFGGNRGDVFNAIEADEKMYDPKRKMFRFWWD